MSGQDVGHAKALQPLACGPRFGLPNERAKCVAKKRVAAVQSAGMTDAADENRATIEPKKITMPFRDSVPEESDEYCLVTPSY